MKYIRHAMGVKVFLAPVACPALPHIPLHCETRTLGGALKIYPSSPWPRLEGQARRFHAMLKPGSSICNLACSYCYYLHKDELLGSESNFGISDDVLEAYIRQYIEGHDGGEVVFSWQGGEPTLLGLEFFEKVVALQRNYKQPNQSIENDLQTNGTLLDENWASFLREHKWLVGLSIDGPKELHDEYRITKGGQPTFEKVFASSQLLHKYSVAFNSLTVVTRKSAKRPLDVYRFLTREVRPRRLQFIPCVEPKCFQSVAPQKWEPLSLPIVGPANRESFVTEWSVEPDDWGTFLCKLWDEWYRRDYGKAFVNLFETAVAQWMGLPAQVCVYNEFCGKAVVVERDGSVFCCDHYVYPAYRLGNIKETSLSRMVFSPRQRAFGFAKRESLPSQCRECQYLFACWGECPRNRFVGTDAGEPGVNYLCSGLRKFWTHIDRDMPEIMLRIRRGVDLNRYVGS